MKRHSILDKDHNLIFEVEADSIQLFQSSANLPLVKVSAHGVEKILDLKGRTIIDGEYESISILEKGESVNYYIVHKNNKFGYIREDGAKITELVFSEFASWHNKKFVNGYALVIEKGVKKFIAEDGSIFKEVETSVGSGFNNGMALLKKDGFYGYMNTGGENLSGYIYSDAYGFTKEGYGIVAHKGKWGIIDTSCNSVVDFEFDEISIFPSNYGVKFSGELFKVKKEKSFGVIKVNLKSSTDIFYKDIICINENYFVVKKDKSWGVVDLFDKEIIPFIYDGIEIRNNYCITKKGKKISVFELTNPQEVICSGDSYKLLSDFAAIKNKNVINHFDLRGGNFLKIESGVAIDKIEAVYEKLLVCSVENKFGVLDLEGKPLIDFDFDEIKAVFDTKNEPFFIVKKSGLMGMLNGKEDTVIDTIYNFISFRANHFILKLNDRKGLCSLFGKVVLDVIYNDINCDELDSDYYFIANQISDSSSLIDYFVSRETKTSNQCRIIVLSTIVNDFTYIISIGYTGGGVWGEVIAKIKSEDYWKSSSGNFASNLNATEWAYQYSGESCNEITSPIDEKDLQVFRKLESELFKNYIYYDDNSVELADIPLLNKEFMNRLKSKTFDSSSATWKYQNLSKHWGLLYNW